MGEKKYSTEIAVTLLLFVVLSTTSCATIVSGRSYIMSISSDLSGAEVIISQSDGNELPARVEIIRSPENLDFTILQNDTIVNNTVYHRKN